jgi:hypothetical protein
LTDLLRDYVGSGPGRRQNANLVVALKEKAFGALLTREAGLPQDGTGTWL